MAVRNGGFAGKILRVDLSTGKIEKQDTIERYEAVLGGAGLGYRVLWDEVPTGTGPFDPANKLVFAAGVLAVGAIRIFKGAWDALMDRQAPPEVIEGIATLARNWPGVLGFHDLKTRTAGSRIFVHLHIELDGALTLREAHDIGAGLRRTILLAYPQADVIIHKDVAETAGA